MAVLINNTLFGLLSSCKHTLKIETAKVQVAVFPELSVAVQVTIVVPTGNEDPEGGVQTTELTPQLSVTGGVA